MCLLATVSLKDELFGLQRGRKVTFHPLGEMTSFLEGLESLQKVIFRERSPLNFSSLEMESSDEEDYWPYLSRGDAAPSERHRRVQQQLYEALSTLKDENPLVRSEKLSPPRGFFQWAEAIELCYSKEEIISSYSFVQDEVPRLRLLNITDFLPLAQKCFRPITHVPLYSLVGPIRVMLDELKIVRDGIYADHSFLCTSGEDITLNLYDGCAHLSVLSPQPLETVQIVYRHKEDFLIARGEEVEKNSQGYLYRFLTTNRQEVFTFPERILPRAPLGTLFLQTKPAKIAITLSMRALYLSSDLLEKKCPIIPLIQTEPLGWNWLRDGFRPPLDDILVFLPTVLVDLVEEMSHHYPIYLSMGSHFVVPFLLDFNTLSWRAATCDWISPF